MAALDERMKDLMQKAFLFFTHENVIFSFDPAQIVVGPQEENHIITEDKFYDLQKILKRMYFLEVEGEEIEISKDENPKVAEIKRKIRANREKVRRAKANKAARDKTDLSFSDLIKFNSSISDIIF